MTMNYTTCSTAAQQHRIFRHYTSYDSLVSILKGQSLLLNRLDRMNDKFEDLHLADCFRGKFFATCFSHGREENIHMWMAYGGKKSKDGYLNREEGVCLELKTLDAFKSITKLHSPSQREKDYWCIYKIAVLDVIYTKCLHDFYAEFDPLDTGLSVQAPRCCGYVKPKIWANEKETRIICRIEPTDRNHRIHRFNPLLRTDKTGVNCIPDFDRIFIDIPHENMKDISIRFSPFMPKKVQAERVDQLLGEFGFLGRSTIRASALTDLVS